MTLAPPLRVLDTRGTTALEMYGLDRLLADVVAPTPARRPWLTASARAYPALEPWVVAVGGGDRLLAAATLTIARRRGLTRVAALGQGLADHALLPAVSPDAAGELAAALDRALRALPTPWTLRVEQLPAGDPVAAALARSLPAARVEPGDDLPYLEIPVGADPSRYAPKKFRQQTRNAQTRFDSAEVPTALTHTRDAAEVETLLPQLREVRLARDHAAGRVSDLDDPFRAGWWRTTALALAARGELEATVLTAGGDVAAYCLGLLDGDTYRLWDGRFHPCFAEQAPGQLLYGRLLERLVTDGTWRTVDFLRGQTPFKAKVTHAALHREHLVAASSSAVLAAVSSPGRARAAARALKGRSPAVARTWAGVKQVRLRGLS